MEEKNESKTRADGQLADAFRNLTVNINNLQTFYLTTTDLLDVGKDYVEHKTIAMGKQELDKPEWKQFKSLKNTASAPSLVEACLRATGKRSLRLSHQIVDSASLVFAHSVLDGTLSDCCTISFEAQPADWFRFVEKRKIELSELHTMNVEDHWKRKAGEYVGQLKREPMTTRLEVLNKICIPLLGGELSPTRFIDIDQLERFDHLRQKAVHGPSFSDKIVKVQDQVMFAAAAGFYALLLVGKAHGLTAGGILDKGNSDPESVFTKLFGSIWTDCPEFEEPLKEIDRLIEEIKKRMSVT